MRLNELLLGESATIVAIEENENLIRLNDLGFVPGALITCVLNSPLHNPRMYRLLSSHIALRDEDAHLIHIKAEVS